MATPIGALTGFLRPGQKMVNWIQRERANGLSEIPPYAPYLAPPMRCPATPWLPGVTERKSSFDYRSKNSRQDQRRLVPKALSVRSWMLYRPLFLMDGERCGAFQAFGGLCAQLNLVAIALNLCVAENVGLGLTYSEISRSRLEESARMRIIAPTEFSSLRGRDQLCVKEQARREPLYSPDRMRRRVAPTLRLSCVLKGGTAHQFDSGTKTALPSTTAGTLPVEELEIPLIRMHQRQVHVDRG